MPVLCVRVLFCSPSHGKGRAQVPGDKHLGEREGFYVALSLYIPVSRGGGVKDTRSHGLLLCGHDLLEDYSKSRQPDAWDNHSGYVSASVISALQFDVETPSVERCCSYSLNLSTTLQPCCLLGQ